MSPERMYSILQAAKAKWRTAKELVPAVGICETDYLRRTLYRMRDLGLLRARHRPKQAGESGDKPSGPAPVEFRVSSKWGGLG